MKQLFSKLLVAFLLTSAVVLSWSEYFLVIASIWIAIYLKFADHDDISQESRYDSNLSEFKGDKLSSLKVGSCN